MASYILRDLPQQTWDGFKARAIRDRWHLRALFLRLMDDYAAGRITPSADAASTPPTGFFPFTCPRGHEVNPRFTKRELLEQKLVPGSVFCINCGTSYPLPDEARDTIESWTHTADTKW